jgi:hypothetical protein
MLASGRKQRDTADWETPANCATSYEVGRELDDAATGLRSGFRLRLPRRVLGDLFNASPTFQRISN